MVRVELYFNKNVLYRFKVSGHAGYDEHGSDIVCAGVSTLVINTINSISEFTDESMDLSEMDNQKGIIECSFPGAKSGKLDSKATVLLDSMILGLDSIEQMYGEYIEINHKKRLNLGGDS